MKAIWNEYVIAESDQTISLEGNQYFPIEAVKKEFLKQSSTQTVCHWKGTASYYSLEVEGKVNPDAAWYYKEPSHASRQIKDHIAFWKGVQIVEE